MCYAAQCQHNEYYNKHLYNLIETNNIHFTCAKSSDHIGNVWWYDAHIVKVLLILYSDSKMYLGKKGQLFQIIKVTWLKKSEKYDFKWITLKE